MSLYIYEATGKEGSLVKGELEADNKQAVVDYLFKRDLIPLRIEEMGVVEAKVFSSAIFEKITPLDRILLIRNLAASIKAGLSIIETLDILIADANKKILRNILIQAKTNVQSGQPLSATFAFYKKYFPPIFVGMVRAGEVSGQLDKNLEQLAKQLTKEYNSERKVKSALTYPVLLLIGSVGAVTLLLGFVLPKLAKTFQQSGVELPLVTRIFIKIGEMISFSPLLDLIVIAILIWFFSYFRKTNYGQRLFATISFRLPIVKDLVKKSALVRLTRSLGNLIASGIPLTESLQLAGEAVGNEKYKGAIREAQKQVTEGILFSKTFERFPDLFPRFLTSLILVGEKTGTLENVLLLFSDFYEDELDNTLKDITTFIEPAMLLIMGLVIGAIAFSILLPIYQLVGKFI